MNAFELKLKQDLEAENPGCVVLRNGYPDFTVVEPSGRIRKEVEGKAPGDTLSEDQKLMQRAHAASGVVVETWYGLGVGGYVVRKPEA